ncbi:MAG TPA: S8 family serine peptidase, partial [Polyangiales bacterium]|nr:S8 family serine peptidase [Polyangiales bacterium]
LFSLAHQPEVLVVHEDMQTESHLAESLPLIAQPTVAANGQLGAGTAVAVLDTGCDYVRSAFGSCPSAGATNCKVAYAADFGTSDNVRDTSFHGTNVSAIVLGVAPATKILALDVFEGQYASASTIIRAIDWVISNRARYNIVAMNMSLGGGSYSAQCGSDVFATAIGNARNAGILSAISSGNSSTTTAISSPACVPTAISVGAVYDANVGGVRYTGCSDATTSADKVTCFSNSASFLSVLAPGAPITAGGVAMSGTSQAAPHVAGAVAVARGAFPNEPISATVSRIVDNGPSITDPRNGVTLHRLNLDAALGGSGVADVTAPTGTVRINQGAGTTRAQLVDLALRASDDGGAVSVCVSNTTTCTAFTALTTPTTSMSWSLSTGNGMKTVYVILRDPSNNRTMLSASIMLDNTAPRSITASATAADEQVQLSWSAASDAHSGISGYRVYAIANSTNAPSCSSGAMIYSGASTSYTHSALTNGTYYSYRVCPVDVAGNVG